MTIRPLRVAKLFTVFGWEFICAVARVAKLVLSPRIDIQPAFFEFPLMLTSDIQIAMLANMITLTPGTLTADVSPDRKTLLIHAIDCPDPEAARQQIASGFERLIREAFPQ